MEVVINSRIAFTKEQGNIIEHTKASKYICTFHYIPVYLYNSIRIIGLKEQLNVHFQVLSSHIIFWP